MQGHEHLVSISRCMCSAAPTGVSVALPRRYIRTHISGHTYNGTHVRACMQGHTSSARVRVALPAHACRNGVRACAHPFPSFPPFLVPFMNVRVFVRRGRTDRHGNLQQVQGRVGAECGGVHHLCRNSHQEKEEAPLSAARPRDALKPV